MLNAGGVHIGLLGGALDKQVQQMNVRGWNIKKVAWNEMYKIVVPKAWCGGPVITE